MAAEDIMGLAIEIAADPSQAVAAIEEFRAQAKSAQESIAAANAATASSAEQAVQAVRQVAAAQGETNATAEAMRRTIAESLQMQGTSAEEAAQIYKQMGISGQQAAAEISSAFGTVGAAAEEATTSAAGGMNRWHGMNQGVIGDLRTMRYAMYAFTTPMMFAYIIPEIARLVTGIQDGISALEGFDSAAQKAFADLVKGADEGLTKFQGLTTAQKIWQGQQLEAQTQQRINFDVTMREAIEAQSYWHNLAMEMRPVLDLLSGNTVAAAADAAVFASQFKIKADALKDELQQEALLSKQHQELARLEQQLQKEQAKTITSINKFSQAQQRMDEAIATAQVKLPPYIVEVDRLTASIAQQESGVSGTLQILKQYQELLREGFPSPQQLGFQVDNSQAPISTQIQQVQQLTEAQRLALPTERELALATQELTRDYPTLTNAERAEWAQIMLTSDAYRKHIDEASRVKTSNAQLAGSFNALATQVRTAFSEMAGQLTGWGGVATRVFDQVFNSITRQIEIEQRQAAEHQISQFSMTKATIDGLKQLAPVKAIIDTAKGIEALASLDFAAAAGWFAAAALWGTVGAFQIASMAGAFQPGTSGSKAVASAATASGGSAAGSHALASGSESALTSGNNQQTIQVIFHGDVYGAGGMTEVIRRINAEVKINRVQLFASHTIYGKAIT